MQGPLLTRKPKTSKRVFFTLILGALFLSQITLAAETFTASVDRNVINTQETLQLTLRSSKQQFFSKPDLSPLHEHFEVLGTQQSSQMQSINGKSSSWTDWIVTLRPKRIGKVVIPPIKFDGLSSQPITIDVLKGSAKPPTNQASPVFIESSLNKQDVFVQAQAILTLRIYHSAPLYDDSSLTPLQIPDAIVESLGDPEQFETVIDGRRYGVFELKYAIYPQKAGQLSIPPQTFSGTVVSRQSNNGYDPFGTMFGSRIGKQIQVNSPHIKLKVKPKPSTYPNAQWLPADNLQLTETWSGNPDKLKVGDSITRTVTLEASGLPGNQLPQIPLPALTHIKLYPDQSKTKNTPTTKGLIGTRIEAQALVATQPGTVTLPALRYPWFDVNTGTVKVAELPAKTFTITGSAVSHTVTPSVSNQIQPQALPKNVESAPLPAVNLIWPWQLATAITGLLALLFAVLWLKGTQVRPESDKSKSCEPGDIKEKECFSMLIKSCQSGNLTEVPGAYLSWYQCWASQPATSFLQAIRCSKDNVLIEQAESLNQSLYSDSKTQSGRFNQQLFIEHCKKLRQQKSKPKNLNQYKLYPEAG